MKAKSKPNVKQAVLQQYPFLPDVFRGNDLHKLVKLVTGRRLIHTDSSIRKLHQLRTDGKINFKRLGEKADSLYQKL